MRRSSMPAASVAIAGLALVGSISIEAEAQLGGGPPSSTPIGSGSIGSVVCPPPPCLPAPIVPCPPTVIHYAPRVRLLPAPFGFVPYAPPLIVTSGPVIAPVPPAFGYGYGYGFGPVSPFAIAPGPIQPPLGPPPPRIVNDRRQDRPVRPVRREADAAPNNRLSDRASTYLTFGDRHFRAGDLRRAEGRYRQALASAPTSPEPRSRMAQLAIARGDYREAAARLREAIAAEAGWLTRARDVQGLYAEPADFHEVLEAIEAHLQAEPDDRDAWLVLGAQLYLSDRVDRAADIFLRLADRRPDATLAALMRASGVDH